MYGQPPPMYPQPGYGAPPPAYYPPPQQQGPMIINMGGQNQGGEGSPCPVCAHDTGNIPRKTVGTVTILWCLCLAFTTGFLCALCPFCTDGCKDTELICVKCQTVKSKIPANCC